MKLLNIVSMILALAAFTPRAPSVAQESPPETQVVEGDANACELNSAYLDYMLMEQRARGERIFVIARLGRGEVNRSLNRRRLWSAGFYLLESGRTRKEQVVFAEGERVDGGGRVEFYLGSRLFLVSLAGRGKNVCLTCCEDYMPPKGNRSRRRRG
jgi:hypothetical protein